MLKTVKQLLQVSSEGNCDLSTITSSIDPVAVYFECQMAHMAVTVLLYEAINQRIVNRALVVLVLVPCKSLVSKDTAHEDNLSSE